MEMTRVELLASIAAEFKKVGGEDLHARLKNIIDSAILTEDYSPGGGSFITLTDAPASYSGQAGKFPKVKAGEDGLEFVALSGGGDMLASNNLSDIPNPTTARTNISAEELGAAAAALASANGYTDSEIAALISDINTALAGKANSLGADDNYVTDAEKVILSNTSGTNSGNETASSVGAIVSGSVAATPNDTDLLATAESSVIKKITWTNVKAFLKTYFDGLYQAAGTYLTSANIEDAIADGVTTKAPSQNAVFDALAGKQAAGSYAAALGADDNYVTDAEKVVIANTSGTNSGNETTGTLGATINGAVAATPNDTDLVTTVDTSVVKKITWTNVKAFLKTYFDGLYATITNLNLKAPIDSPTFTGTVSGITKTMVGLGSVDNTSDAGKPVSTAQQAALFDMAPLASPSFTGTPSFASGIPAANLPNGLTNGNTGEQSQIVVSATNYYITNSNLNLPATLKAGIVVGTKFVWTVYMSKTAAGTGIFQISIYRGTNGSTADTQDVLQTIGTQTAVVDSMCVDITLVITATGATGSYFWSMCPTHAAATATGFGVATGTTGLFSGTVSAVNLTTASLKFGLGFKATTGTPTIRVVQVQAQAINLD